MLFLLFFNQSAEIRTRYKINRQLGFFIRRSRGIKSLTNRLPNRSSSQNHPGRSISSNSPFPLIDKENAAKSFEKDSSVHILQFCSFFCQRSGYQGSTNVWRRSSCNKAGTKAHHHWKAHRVNCWIVIHLESFQTTLKARTTETLQSSLNILTFSRAVPPTIAIDTLHTDSQTSHAYCKRNIY